MRVAALAVVLLAGCAAPDHLQLDARWRPLERLQANPATPPGVFQTVSPLLLCHSVSDFEAASAVEQEGLLKHEQLHALRQEAGGPSGEAYWLARYATDLQFRWEEERLGWSLQVRTVAALGGSTDVHLVASFLSGPAYSDAWGRPMVSYQAALDWLDDVLAGRQ